MTGDRKKLTDFTSYAAAQDLFSKERLWELLDGTPEALNLAHECVDRHAPSDQTALVIAHADGRDELISWTDLAAASSRFAHHLVARGIRKGDHVALMLEPSLPFYAALFGILKAGAVVVPLFTLFGPQAIAVRLRESGAKLLLTNADKGPEAVEAGEAPFLVVDDVLLRRLQSLPDKFETRTAANDPAILQFTSGTTRDVPAGVMQRHKSIVTLLMSALYGTGIRPGDRFFCPSSPGWSHGLWPGTLSPMALGVPTGTMAGKFDPLRLLGVLSDHRITNMTAAATHYRMIRNCGAAEGMDFALCKLSFAGEPMDDATAEYTKAVFSCPVSSIYGNSEVGAILVHYPGAEDFAVPPGSLGKALPGVRVRVQDDQGGAATPGEVGEIVVWRRGEWVQTKDLGRQDDAGFFYYAGRADDVIISAGYTISAVEVENVILQHPDVADVGVIGVPNALRGLVVAAFVVSGRPEDERFSEEIRDIVRERLGRHEYPRVVTFVLDLPKNPAGKVDRRKLRAREAAHEITV